MKMQVDCYITHVVRIEVEAATKDEAFDKASVALGSKKVPGDMDGRLDTEYEIGDDE